MAPREHPPAGPGGLLLLSAIVLRQPRSCRDGDERDLLRAWRARPFLPGQLVPPCAACPQTRSDNPPALARRPPLALRHPVSEIAQKRHEPLPTANGSRSAEH